MKIKYHLNQKFNQTQQKLLCYLKINGYNIIVNFYNYVQL